jgi:hypothetical protein
MAFNKAIQNALLARRLELDIQPVLIGADNNAIAKFLVEHPRPDGYLVSARGS